MGTVLARISGDRSNSDSAVEVSDRPWGKGFSHFEGYLLRMDLRCEWAFLRLADLGARMQVWRGVQDPAVTTLLRKPN